MRLKALALLMLSLWLTSAACAPQVTPTSTPAPTQAPTLPTAAAPASGGYTVTDALGRSVAFSQAPQKMALVGKALFMVADALYLFPDASTRIVALGATNQGSSNFIPMIDAHFSSKIILKSDASPEEIAAVQPDCVIMKSSNAEKLGLPLETLKIPVVYVDFETPAQYWRDLKILGAVLQDEARAQTVAAFYQSRMDATLKLTAALQDEQKPRTLLLYYTEQGGAVSFNVPPSNWMQTQLTQMAGGRPVWEGANPGQGWAKVTLEQVAAWDADAIFIVAYTSPIDEVVAKLKSDPQWQTLRALKNKQLYGFATDVYSWDQPDSRWILGLSWMAGQLHPELFPGQDMKKEAATLYQELYGMDDPAFQKNIAPKLTGVLP